MRASVRVYMCILKRVGKQCGFNESIKKLLAVSSRFQAVYYARDVIRGITRTDAHNFLDLLSRLREGRGNAGDRV